MGNTNSCIRHLKEVFSSLTGASSVSEYVSAPAASETEDAPTSSPPLFDRAYTECMIERSESGKHRSIEESIERSKCHWSVLAESGSNEEEVAEVSNVEVFKTLQLHPTWDRFFLSFGEGEDDAGELVVGEKFAEGAQAELYEVKVKWRDPMNNELDLKDGRSWVVKVFKKGTFLRYLQSQWPHGYLDFRAELMELARSNTFKPIPRYYCEVHCGTLLKDGRFAFLMEREDEDLRSLIDRNMKFRRTQDGGPFPAKVSQTIMYRVAVGMDWLHSRNIVHRDLKASNVLVYEHKDGLYDCFVADFECSIGVVGTGFFRAPEILQACKDKSASSRPKLSTKQADVYSYGMTCYEILTGKLPFEGHPVRDYDHVLKGQRPVVPDYVDDRTRELLSRCWQTNPDARPSFGEIVDLLDKIYAET